MYLIFLWAQFIGVMWSKNYSFTLLFTQGKRLNSHPSVFFDKNKIYRNFL